MATWEELATYAAGKYTLVERTLERIELQFRTEDDRSQRVEIFRREFSGAEWIEITTTVCKQGDVDAATALEANGTMVVGALATRDGMLVLKFPLLLADLDPTEFDIPIGIVVEFGDMLEAQFTGADVY